MEEFDYFMIRIRRQGPGDRAGAAAGVVERLGTGEKRSFASGEELLRFVYEGCGTPSNRQSGEEPGKS